jgi:hypothetical protein
MRLLVVEDDSKIASFVVKGPEGSRDSQSTTAATARKR